MAGVPWGTGTAGGSAVYTVTNVSVGRETHGLSARSPGGEGALNLVMPTAVLRGEHALFSGGRSGLVFSRVRLRLVPEPATGASLIAAALLLGLLGRRKLLRGRVR
jgi:hypothetical protein